MTKKNISNLIDFFSFFESDDLLARLSILNNLSSFVSLVVYNNEFLDAKDIISSNPRLYAPLIIDRVDKLLKTSNPRNLHPYDISAACYLLLIAETSSTYLLSLLKKIKGKKLNNLCWTNLVIDYVTKKNILDVKNESLKLNIEKEDKKPEDIEELELKVNNKKSQFIEGKNVFMVS